MSALPASLLELQAHSSIAAAVDWIASTLLGSVAIGIAVLSVALIGLLMLTGRLPLRQGVQVVVGCFVLLGAPVIASGLVDITSSTSSEPMPLPPQTAQLLEPREELPPAEYNPYAGASLRSD